MGKDAILVWSANYRVCKVNAKVHHKTSLARPDNYAKLAVAFRQFWFLALEKNISACYAYEKETPGANWNRKIFEADLKNGT